MRSSQLYESLNIGKYSESGWPETVTEDISSGLTKESTFLGLTDELCQRRCPSIEPPQVHVVFTAWGVH